VENLYLFVESPAPGVDNSPQNGDKSIAKSRLGEITWGYRQVFHKLSTVQSAWERAIPRFSSVSTSSTIATFFLNLIRMWLPTRLKRGQLIPPMNS